MEILSGLMNQNKKSIVSRLIVGVGLLYQENIYQALLIKRLWYKLYLTDLDVFGSVFSTTSLPLWQEPPFCFSACPPAHHSTSTFRCSSFFVKKLTAVAIMRCNFKDLFWTGGMKYSGWTPQGTCLLDLESIKYKRPKNKPREICTYFWLT